MSDQTQGPDAPPFEDTPLKQAIRCAFDYPTVVNIEAVAAAALLPQLAERPALVAAVIEAELQRWYDESPTGTALVVGFRGHLRKFAERVIAALASPLVE